MSESKEVIPEAAVPMIARNAAWVALASKFPNSDLVHSEDFIRAIDEALEAAAPHMMAIVSTIAELDALPRLSVIRSDEGAVFEKHTMWHEAGSRDLLYSPDIALPATVLQLGWGQE